MIFKHLWERHLLSQLLKTFFFALFSFYFLYIVIDYSIHSHHFSHNRNLSWFDLCFYYFYLLMKRADLVHPLAFIIATNKVLLSLNQSHAMISLFVGGLKKLALLRPIMMVASAIAAILLFNFEYISPKALSYLDSFEHKNFRKNSLQDYSTLSAYNLPLEDGSELLFSKYDEEQRCFEDVYYIKSLDDIWKMKFFQLKEEGAEGIDVEHIIKNPNHLLIKEDEYKSLVFPGLYIDWLGKESIVIPFEHQSISSLYRILSSDPSAPATTQLIFKLFNPFASFLFIIACTPFCITFSRKLPIFLIYAMSIFGIVSFFIVMDAAVILGENQIFPPYIAIASPYLICLAGFFKKFMKVYLK